MIAFLTVLYAIASIVVIIGYIPNIAKMIKERKSDTSLFGWFVWWSTSIVSVLYFGFVSFDVLALIVQFGHFFGISAVIGIQLYKRKKYGHS